MTASVEVRNVTKAFGRVVALDRVSLAVEAGELAVLLGPSGCGKSTLLLVLGGFLAPDEGQVLIGGQDMTALPASRRPTTTVFQDYALFPHMSLLDNVGFGLRMRGWPRRRRRARAGELLELVGLGAAAAQRPHELSGGQRQRVALARALAVEPEVLLLDEPLGALDLKLRRAMQDELKAIQRRVGTTFVHVTHDQEEAMAIADRIVVMNQGRIEDMGAPDAVYLTPRSLFAAGFMGEINMIPGAVRAAEGAAITVETPLGLVRLPRACFARAEPAPATAVTVCIRPEHFRESLDRKPLEGAAADGALDLGQARVLDSAFFGTHLRCHLAPAKAPGLVLVAHLPQGARVRDGEAVALAVDPARVVALPSEH
jgi:spermidine/putrescine transport system ATP-binding protein